MTGILGKSDWSLWGMRDYKGKVEVYCATTVSSILRKFNGF